MNDRQLKIANINNLTQLWKLMGAETHFIEGMGEWHISAGWPNRCWFESEFPVDQIPKFSHCINQAAQNSIIPVWAEPSARANQLENILVSNGFEFLFEQTAMYLDPKNYPNINQTDLEIKLIKSKQDIEIWTNIAARSFEYKIDKSVIQKIALSPNVQLFMVYASNHPRATVMLFNTDKIIGIHQMGVLPEYRGQGIARKLMRDIIRLCIQIPVKYIILQASTAGEPLYKNLGFKPQFKIKSYQRIVNINNHQVDV